MSIARSMMAEFDQEMANTRVMLSRVPEDKLDWRPHEKSMTFAGLATHTANIPAWAAMIVEDENVDVAPEGETPLRMTAATSVKELLEGFDETVAKARMLIGGASDERLLGKWTLLTGGRTIFSLPRVGVLRTMVMNHMIHHRAQLGVYLRLNDLPVPGMYGPSADEVAE
ncbi:DinB family protein [bacterium]|nr:DinB family protein [candidate division CSSED10-310 bacterium]